MSVKSGKSSKSTVSDESKTDIVLIPEPTAKEIKDDVHQLLLFAKQRAATLAGAFTIMQGTNVYRQSSMHMDIRQFTPQSAAEIEIQCFNTSMLPPSRFETVDDIANWLLEPIEEINRHSAAIFLSSDTIIAAATLETLATKVLSHERMSSVTFIEALKVFLPLSGCLDLAVAQTASAQQNTLISNFAATYLQHNKSARSASGPSSGSASASDVSISAHLPTHRMLVQISEQVLVTVCALLSEQQTAAEIRDAFMHSLHAIHHSAGSPTKEHADVLLASADADIFSGRALAPLPYAQFPSYLMSHHILLSRAQVRFQQDSGGECMWVALQADAIYLFAHDIRVADHSETSVTTGNRFPQMTIPLAQCNAHLDIDHDRIELASVSGSSLALLQNRRVECPENDDPPVGWWGVVNVSYEAAVLLDIQEGSLQRWLDALESLCWKCRLAKD